MAAAATALSAEHKVPTLWTKANPRTKDELDVLLASVAIREQDDWRSNVLVPEAMAKWKVSLPLSERTRVVACADLLLLCLATDGRQSS